MRNEEKRWSIIHAIREAQGAVANVEARYYATNDIEDMLALLGHLFTLQEAISYAEDALEALQEDK